MMAYLNCGFIKRFALLVLSLAVIMAAFSLCAAQTTTPPLPPPSPFRFVNDYAGVIDAATRDRLEKRLTQLRDQTKIEMAIVTVKTTGDQAIFDYSLALARGWGIGSKDDDNPGLLMLIAVDDRKYFTQVSRDMEGDLPDGVKGSLERKFLVPAFKEGRYSDGISDTIEAFISRLQEQRNFQLSSETAPTPRTRKTSTGLSAGKLCLGALVVIVILIFLGIGSRRGGGGGGGGLINALLIGSLLSNVGRGGGSSDWGSGGFGGGGSGGGGFGGGGFGGGGDFGGGGGGGSW